MTAPPRRWTPRTPGWPAELSTIDAPPEEFWTRGDPDLLARAPRVAIVGSRAPTPYGEGQAERFARVLAAHGVVVVSGLARGVDAAAHRGALDVEGTTIAVLGSGVDRPWPDDDTSARVLRRGLLLSEFQPGTPPRRHHFPLRNRLISGLSAAVVVVEAAFASGSLITARWAADQGRAVFALPGRVDHPMARGCHRLLREGATLVERPEEVLVELGFAASGGRDAPGGARVAESPLLAALRGETRSVDELCAQLGRTPGPLLAELVELELAGRVARAPGGLFRRLEPGTAPGRAPPPVVGD